jgi:hypothetical protein
LPCAFSGPDVSCPVHFVAPTTGKFKIMRLFTLIRASSQRFLKEPMGEE